ncbi:TIGR04282 family arsenosugar biosynthesis glycosyltransferase [Rhodomicrobium lacus]|uniref:TIGR04282 family arsenosugar biosynthesis glycosyltransferase n=1 Tax=Rhodomicrobium lacus TaxID=2498452 RepID=UPI000F8E67B2|nr:TIGR04282 family arsenosugar biosynthesis glycosyltransferase [Rhodomicrobium lacus]
MTRAPICGAVKTRLAREIGPVAASALTRALTARLLRELACDARFRCMLAVSPPTATMARFPAWRAGGRVQRLAQVRGDLGARMQALLDRCGKEPVVVVGTDIPGIAREIIADALRLLRRADAVFGPAEDGGYWLVGLRRRPKILKPFANVRWSSEHALADTLANLQGCRVAFAKTLFDIDTGADYRRYRRLESAATRIIFAKNL